MSRARAAAEKGAPSRARATANPAPRAQLRHSLATLAIGSLWALSLAGIVYGLNWIEPRAQQAAAGTPLILRWRALPAWLQDPSQRPLLDELEALGRIDAPLGPATPQLAAAIAARLRSSPWIAAVHEVAVRASGVVELDASIRMPLALVEKRGMTYLVDRAGVLIQQFAPAAQVDTRQWLIITGAQGSVPLAAGQPFEGEDVHAGLKLAEFLLRCEAAGQFTSRAIVRAIDVSNYRRRLDRWCGDLRLQTTQHRGFVEWGLPPGEEYGIEAPAELKLAQLNHAHQTGRILPDRNVDIRDGDRILVAPQGIDSLTTNGSP